MEVERPAGRFAAVLVAFAALLFAAATIHVARAGDAGRTILGGGAAAIEAVIAMGGLLVATAGAAFSASRWFVLVAGALWGLWLWRLPVDRRGVQPLLAAIALGWTAQAFLLTGGIAFGVAIYALAAALVWLAPPAPPGERAADPVRYSIVWIATLLAVFAVVCLYRLEVIPNLYIDEMAYLRAARMFAGQIEVGTIIGRGPYELYVYEQFVAQTVPIVLQAAAVSVLPSDVIATRLLSVVAVGFALIFAVLALRRPLGDGVVVWMLALGVTSPLLVVYSRAGFYISVSIAHAVVSFAALLWLRRRWDVRAGAVVGVMLGASLYQYQLSWFVPVFALAGFAVMPELWRRAGVVRVVASVAICGILTVLPALLWLETGIEAVNAQTFDRAVWNPPGPDAPSPHETWTGVLAVVPDSVAAAEFDAFLASVEERGLTASVDGTTHGRRMVLVGGGRPQVEAVTAEIRADDGDWLSLDFDWVSKDPLGRLRRMLSQLFFESSWESSGRWVVGPLLNPALASLLVVGLAVAWRRRSEPAIRLLLVWVVGGALLPAIFGGPAPRRTSLMLPFVYAVMALPLVELGTRLAQRSRWERVAGGALAVVLGAAVIASGSHRYFSDWEHQSGLPNGGGELLDYVKLLKTRPVDEKVLSPAMFRGLGNYLDAGDASRFWPERAVEPFRKQPLRVVRELSCAQPPPFTWIARDIPEHRNALEFVSRHYATEADDQADLLVRRATAARSRLCGGAPAGPRSRR